MSKLKKDLLVRLDTIDNLKNNIQPITYKELIKLILHAMDLYKKGIRYEDIN